MSRNLTNYTNEYNEETIECPRKHHLNLPSIQEEV